MAPCRSTTTTRRNVPELFVPQRLLRRHRGQGAAATARSACRSSCGGRGALEDDDAAPAAARRSRQAVDVDAAAQRPARHAGQLHAFATDKKKRRIKIICRYQQYEGANKIVERVRGGPPARRA